jgi:hypothetical protein
VLGLPVSIHSISSSVIRTRPSIAGFGVDNISATCCICLYRLDTEKQRLVANHPIIPRRVALQTGLHCAATS